MKNPPKSKSRRPQPGERWRDCGEGFAMEHAAEAIRPSHYLQRGQRKEAEGEKQKNDHTPDAPDQPQGRHI